MNIVIMTPYWPQVGKANGIVTYYSNLVPALEELGHDVKIITRETNSNDERVFKIFFKPTFLQKLFCRLIEKINLGYESYYYGTRALASTIRSIEKNHKIDIIQMEDSFGWHHYIQKQFKFPVVLRLHGPHFLNNFEDSVSRQSLHRISREKRAFQFAKFVTSPSENVLSLTKKKYNLSWPLEKVVPNSTLPPTQDSRWDLSRIKKHQILFVGRFDSHKGGDILLNAIATLYSNFPDIKLIFIGPDPGLVKDGIKYTLSQYMEKFHASLPVNDVLHHLGEKDKETISAYRAESHLTIISSRYETFGNVALEALSHGSPLVCSDAGALSEIVIDKESGLLFESENSGDLANKIQTLFNNEALCEELSRGAFERAKISFSPLETAQDLVEFFQLATKYNSAS